VKHNLGIIDRLIRAFVLAPVAVVLAALAGWTTGLAIVALVVAGVMLATAALGFCPAYALLGVNTCRTRSRTN
jgi:hypothetical protein